MIYIEDLLHKARDYTGVIELPFPSVNDITKWKESEIRQTFLEVFQLAPKHHFIVKELNGNSFKETKLEDGIFFKEKSVQDGEEYLYYVVRR